MSPSTVNTGRTSVSKLRKSFEAGSEPGEHLVSAGKVLGVARAPGDSRFMLSIKKPALAVSVANETMDNHRATSSLEALDEYNASSVPVKISISPVFSGALRLKTPVWASNVGHTGSLFPSSRPRRSKKSQRSTTERSQSRTSRKSSRVNEPFEDDISPSTSAGAGTPRLASPEPPEASRSPISPVQHPEQYLSATQDFAIRTEEALKQKDTSAPVRSTSRVSELKNVFDQKRQSAVPGDGTFFQPDADTHSIARLPDVAQPSNHSTPWRPAITRKRTSSRQKVEAQDDEATSTCAIFTCTSPFRRGSTSALPSPVREGISIFEGLIKPGKNSPQKADAKALLPKKHRSKSQPFLTGTGVLDGKRRPVGWTHNPFRKKPLHTGRSRMQSEKRSQDTAQANELSENGVRAKAKHTASVEQLTIGGPPVQEASESGDSNDKPRVQH